MNVMDHTVPARLRRLDAITWFAVFPGAFLVLGVGAYIWMQQHGSPLSNDSPLQPYLDLLVGSTVGAMLLAVVLARRLRATFFPTYTGPRPGSDDQLLTQDALFRMFQGRKFLLAALLDMPLFFGLLLAFAAHLPGLALFIGLWSLVPAYFCRPDLRRSLGVLLTVPGEPG